MRPEIINNIFDIRNRDDFLKAALEVFNYQANNNFIYQQFLKLLGIDNCEVDSLVKIPFLPAEFYRRTKVITGARPEVMIFESSGTEGTVAGKHYVIDPDIYKESFLRTFSLFYCNPEEYFIAALLPSYTERKNSSLVFMMDEIIHRSVNPDSGFYERNIPEMLLKIKVARDKGEKILLMGVSFALLDLAEKYHPDLKGVIVMETGGMKGRRKEITRVEMHSILKQNFNIECIHSEYGMTELFSQAYSKGDGIFYSPPWMKVFIRDAHDPLSIITEPGRTGGINIIDLANIDSCSFLATDDLGKLHEDGSFEVLGRLDISDIRGCNLMIE
jgi:phenylacetate-coenzyme A ligase PaaK-like adenylate-forming protein